MNEYISPDFLKEKGIELRGMLRIYILDLTNREYTLDSFRPFELHIDDKVIEEATWNRLIIRVCNYLINKYKISEKSMLDCEANWSKAPIFLEEPYSEAHFKLDNNLHINLNRTCTHLVWTLIEIFKLFSFDYSKCKLYVRIPQYREKEDVRNHFYNSNKSKFFNYLVDELKISTQKSESIIQSIITIDELLGNFNHRIISIFLFDDKQEYSNFKSRFRVYISKRVKNDKQRIIIDNVLTFYGKYLAYSYNEIEKLKLNFSF